MNELMPISTSVSRVQHFAFPGAKVYEAEIPETMTLAEIANTVPGLPKSFWVLPPEEGGGIILIDGHEVYREYWHVVRPLGCREVTIGCIPQDSFFSNPLQSILTIATFAVATLVTGGLAAPLLGAAFGAGTLGAAALGLGVAFAGNLLINSLFPAPTPSLGTGLGLIGSAERGEGRSFGEASIGSNVVARNALIPSVLGSMRGSPPMLMRPYTEIDGDDEYGYAIIAYSGAHKVEDIQVNKVSIDNFEGVEYEVREGWDSDAPIGLITKQVKPTEVGTDLTKYRWETNNDNQIKGGPSPQDFMPQWYTILTDQAPNSIRLRFGMAAFYNPGDATQSQQLVMQFRIRKKGDPSWRNIGQCCWQGRSEGIYQAEARIHFVDELPSAEAFNPNEIPGGGVNVWLQDSVFDFAYPNLTTNHLSTASGNSPFQSHWTSGTNIRGRVTAFNVYNFFIKDTYFADTEARYEVSFRRSEMLNDTNFNYTNGVTYQTTNVFDVFDARPVTSGGFITHYDTIENPKNQNEQVRLIHYSSVWNEHPVPKPGLCLIALKFRNLKIDSVTAQFSKYVRLFQGNRFTGWAISSNPALCYIHVITGEQNKRALPSNLIGFDNLSQWRDKCNAMNYRCNMIAEGSSVFETMRIIASTGRAQIRQLDTWEVFFDHDWSNDTILQVLTPRNSRNFTESLTFTDVPKTLRGKYVDRDNEYKVEEIRVDNDFGGTSPEEEIELTGLTTTDEVVSTLRYLMAEAFYRHKKVSVEVGEERLLCQRGDLIGVSHNLMQKNVGFAAVRSVSGGGNTLVLDYDVTPHNPDGTSIFAVSNIFTLQDIFDQGKTPYIQIRTLSGVHLAEVTSYVSATKTATLATAVSDAAKDNLLVFGPGTQIMERMIVIKTEPVGDAWRITAMPEAPELEAFL